MAYLTRTDATTTRIRPEPRLPSKFTARFQPKFEPELDPEFAAEKTSRPQRLEINRPELGPLLSVLFLMLDEARSMVVHVASARPGEGTTTIARDIAAAAAMTGWCNVALLDAHPGVQPGGTGDGELWPGLIQTCLRGESLALRPSLIGSQSIDVGLLSEAQGPISRLDLVRRIYGALRRHYSLIVVDCPPVLAGQQSLTLAPAADETILVVKAEQTRLAEVRRAQEALQQRGASIMGVVLNQARRRVPGLLDRAL